MRRSFTLGAGFRSLSGRAVHTKGDPERSPLDYSRCGLAHSNAHPISLKSSRTCGTSLPPLRPGILAS